MLYCKIPWLSQASPCHGLASLPHIERDASIVILKGTGIGLPDAQIKQH